VVEVTGSQATVWGWAEKHRTGGNTVDAAWLANACGQALNQAEEVAQASTDRWILPDQILVGLPASQLCGQAWSVTQHRSQPSHPIEEQELAALLERTLRLAINKLQSTVSNSSDWVLVDAVPVALTIDGRGVTDPVGFRASEIGATVFAALAPAMVIKAWESVARQLEFSTLTLQAAPLALSACLSTPQGMLVDIGGATTDLVWCRAGCPIAIASLPIGSAELVNTLVRKWRLSTERAERLMRAYGRRQLTDEAIAQVQDVLSPALQAWLAQTENALAELNQDEPLPQRFHLLGGGSALPDITEAVRALAWSQRLNFTRYPEVSKLQSTDVPGVVNRTEEGQSPGDVPALALAAWAARQHRQPDRPARMLAELFHS
jgi:cell division ATPase FtsA